jgi:hypothetical protein
MKCYARSKLELSTYTDFEIKYSFSYAETKHVRKCSKIKYDFIIYQFNLSTILNTSRIKCEAMQILIPSPIFNKRHVHKVSFPLVPQLANLKLSEATAHT